MLPCLFRRRVWLNTVATLALGVALLASARGSVAYAADPPRDGTTGQPNQSCETSFRENGPFTPNGFNTDGFNHATTVYAGTQPQNSKKPHSVAQYDVACFQQSQH